MHVPWLPSVFLLLAVLGSTGCSTDCQELCTAWYDYQRDVCGLVNTDDDRVTCISDYRRSQSTEQELADCSERIPDVAALHDAGDDSCCTWSVGTCPSEGDNADSARR